MQKVTSAGKVFCSSQGWSRANTDSGMRYCCMAKHFCAPVNDDAVVVMIKCFAPLNVDHVQTLILQFVLMHG